MQFLKDTLLCEVSWHQPWNLLPNGIRLLLISREYALIYLKNKDRVMEGIVEMRNRTHFALGRMRVEGLIAYA